MRFSEAPASLLLHNSTVRAAKAVARVLPDLWRHTRPVSLTSSRTPAACRTHFHRDLAMLRHEGQSVGVQVVETMRALDACAHAANCRQQDL